MVEETDSEHMPYYSQHLVSDWFGSLTEKRRRLREERMLEEEWTAKGEREQSIGF